MEQIEKRNPLANIDTSFFHYVERRKNVAQAHMENGIPDYAFALDYELRAKILKIPHFYSISKKITETMVAQEMQKMNQEGLAVGPNQYPDIYQMGVECAKRLGIGIPNIYVLGNPNMNAYTIAADDTSPMVVILSGLIERMTPAELKCVIAHECGHIHNNHAVFKTVVNAILSSGSGILGFALTAANLALMQFWTRAGEITCDRAALICSDHLEDAYCVNGKLLSGGILGRNDELNYEALRSQLDLTLDNPSRIYEINSDHPSALRRIFAEMAFAECEVLYRWRPELKQPDMRVYSRKETDEKCQKLVNILDNK